MATLLFNLIYQSSGTVGTEAWVDLGLLPTGSKWWFGSAMYSAIGKAMTFELRTNTAGKSTGTVANTALLATAAPKANASVSKDLYLKGRLHTATVAGTGVEHAWLRVTSKSATVGTYQYKLFYCIE